MIYIEISLQNRSDLSNPFLFRFIFQMVRRRTVVAGKYLIMTLFPLGNPIQGHLFYADLETLGEIRGKISLKPIYTTDLSSAFEVSMKWSKH